VGSKRRLDW